MTDRNKKIITKKGLAELKDELMYRTKTQRKKIADKLDEAKAIGDLSENAAYTSAVEEYHQNEIKIDDLKKLIKTVEIAPDKSGDAFVDIGDSVKVKEVESGKKLTYDIVGIGEGDPTKGQVSSDSIVGSALMDKKAGDIVEVRLPNKKKKFKVLSIK
jgi:transcription elongation factor GreA